MAKKKRPADADEAHRFKVQAALNMADYRITEAAKAALGAGAADDAENDQGPSDSDAPAMK